jgi:hypothetical protein
VSVRGYRQMAKTDEDVQDPQFTGYGKRPSVEDLFAKGPSGGTNVPISPSFGLSGPSRTSRQPGNFKGRTIEGTTQDRRTVRVPANLLAGHDNNRPGFGDRDNPPDFIADVDMDGNFFSPFQPVYPFGPPNVNYPRAYDYQVGTNLDIYPKRLQLFSMLRALTAASGVIASVMESRIDEIVALPWKFQLKDANGKKSEDDPRIKELTQFFEKPDRKIPFPMWQRMIYRDRYTIDAASAFVWKNRLGTKPYAIMALDGATVKPLIDDWGRIPDAPQPGYQQIIKGLPMNNFTEDELLYMPARPRTDFPIGGYSEVEQIMSESLQMVKKTLYMTNFWEKGTIPDVMLGVPETWTPEQIAVWQASFDALLSGNLNLKSKIRFIPGGMKPFEMKGSAGELLKSEYDEWLTRIVCHVFRVLPKPFVKEPQSRASAEQEKEQIEEQGIQTEMIWWKAFMDRLIVMGWGQNYANIEMVWSLDSEVAATDQATIDTAYLKVGRETINEQRVRAGQDPIEGGDVAMVYTASGAVPLSLLAAQTALPQVGGAGGDDESSSGGSGKSASGKKAGKVAEAPFVKAERPWRQY